MNNEDQEKRIRRTLEAMRKQQAERQEMEEDIHRTNLEMALKLSEKRKKNETNTD